MVQTRTNYTLSVIPVDTQPISNANQITKEYYWSIVGEISRGTMYKSVARVENLTFGITSYHLISYN